MRSMYFNVREKVKVSGLYNLTLGINERASVVD